MSISGMSSLPSSPHSTGTYDGAKGVTDERKSSVIGNVVCVIAPTEVETLIAVCPGTPTVTRRITVSDFGVPSSENEPRSLSKTPESELAVAARPSAGISHQIIIVELISGRQEVRPSTIADDENQTSDQDRSEGSG